MMLGYVILFVVCLLSAVVVLYLFRAVTEITRSAYKTNRELTSYTAKKAGSGKPWGW